MKERRPAYQHYPSDIQSDPRYRALTYHERGIYRDLLDFCWIEQSLPIDDIPRILGITQTEWAEIADRILDLFTCQQVVDNSQNKVWIIRHKRLDQERNKQEIRKNKKKAAGKRGANARWHNNLNGSAIGLPLAKHGSSSSSSHSSVKKEEGAARAASPSDLQKIWNQHGPRKCHRLTPGRKSRAQARLREEPTLAYWQKVCKKIAQSRFCQGENDRHWKADFDFLIRPDTHARVIEGKYDNPSNGRRADWNPQKSEEFLRKYRELRRKFRKQPTNPTPKPQQKPIAKR